MRVNKTKRLHEFLMEYASLMANLSSFINTNRLY